MIGTRPYRAAFLLALFLPAATGCTAGWRAFDPASRPTPIQLPERQVVEFRADSQLIRLHAVRFTRDSVNGIPWLEHTSCDTCRVGYPLAQVTQMRTGSPGRPAWGLTIPFFALTGLVLLFLVTCGNCMST